MHTVLQSAQLQLFSVSSQGENIKVSSIVELFRSQCLRHTRQAKSAMKADNKTKVLDSPPTR